MTQMLEPSGLAKSASLVQFFALKCNAYGSAQIALIK